MSRDPETAERFIAGVRNEFPNILGRQVLPPEAPIQAPHVTLASSSSQLAVSSAQADFEVRFYGGFLDDLDLALEYVERKVLAVLAGFTAVSVEPMMIGIIGTLHFSLEDLDHAKTLAYILRTHVRNDIDPGQVQDVNLRIGVRVRDTYFVNMTVAAYESRILERPLMPGMPAIRVRPWEGRVDDVGIELTLDINNLESRAQQADAVVTEEGVRAVVRLLREVTLTTGPRFAETGEVSTEALTASSHA